MMRGGCAVRSGHPGGWGVRRQRAGHDTDLRRARELSPLLVDLPARALLEALPEARVRHLAGRGQATRIEDDTVALVLEGALATTRPSAEGRDVVLDLAGAGASLGLSGAFGTERSPPEVLALLPLELLLLPGSRLRDWTHAVPAFGTACLQRLANDLEAAHRDTARYATSSTSERVVDRLLHLVACWGEPVADGVRIALPLTQELLASWARASRESTAKTLHELRRTGIVRTRRRELVVLDVERLQARSPLGPAPSTREPDGQAVGPRGGCDRSLRAPTSGGPGSAP
jgi:CRP/FNR family transcriptional regulator, cyclic AMP receptor protein